MDKNTEISARICKILDEKSLSVEYSAKCCGIPASTMRSYIKNGTSLSLQNAILIIETFNVNPDYLLFGRGPIFRAEFGDEQKDDEAVHGFTPSSPQSVEDSSSIPYSSPSDTLLAKLHAAELQLQALTEANRNLSQAILNLSSK